MTVHKHHVTPVHKGGKNGPIVRLNPWDHAEVHAERFLSGEDDWFHGGLLEFLSDELKVKVKQRYTEVGSGKGHPNYGKKIWTDGKSIVFSTNSPGPEFKPGFPDTYLTQMSESISGLVFWNDGNTQVRSRECPGPQWIRGRLPWKDEHKKSFGNTSRGSKWWTNGKTTKRSVESPGPEWRPGRG